MEFTRTELYTLLNLHPSDRPLWLIEADLSGANLTGANLNRADVTLEQLAEIGSLEDAILPDGTKHTKPSVQW